MVSVLVHEGPSPCPCLWPRTRAEIGSLRAWYPGGFFLRGVCQIIACRLTGFQQNPRISPGIPQVFCPLDRRGDQLGSEPAVRPVRCVPAEVFAEIPTVPSPE